MDQLHLHGDKLLLWVVQSMVCMVFVMVSPDDVTTHVSSSPIFEGVAGFQHPAAFLTDAMVERMTAEIDVIQEECGFYCGSSADHAGLDRTERSISRMLQHFCMFLPPFSGDVDVPTAVFAFYAGYR